MCGRVRQYRAPHELADWAEHVASPFPNAPPRWNLAPSQPALVLRRHPETGARHLDLLRWGLLPRWTKDAARAPKPINARAETIATSGMFRDAFARRRCIVPVDGFYEWRAGPNPKARKQPYAIAMADGEPMALAGLWEGWRAPDGEVIRSFTIVTTTANDHLRPLHERMPVILARPDWPAWLGETEVPQEDLLALLHPWTGERLAVWPVPARIGKVTEDDPGVAERDPLVPATPGLDDAA